MKKSYKARMNRKAEMAAQNATLRRNTHRCRRVPGGFQYKPVIKKTT